MADKILTFNGKTISGPSGTGMVILDIPELPEPEAMTLRFQFSDKSYDPTGVTDKGTWTKVSHPFNNIWDWTYDNPDWSSIFKEKFTNGQNKIRIIDAGDTLAVTKTASLFNDCHNLISIVLFNTKNVTNMQAMFYNTSITELPEFDFSNATNVKHLCYNSPFLKTVGNINLPAATGANLMFAYCPQLETIGTVKFSDNSNITINASSMFARQDDTQCKLTHIKIINFDRINNTQAFFQNQSRLSSIDAIMDFTNQTTMDGIFNRCYALEILPTIINTDDITSMHATFAYTAITAMPDINTGKVTNFERAFVGCEGLTNIRLLNTQSATNVTSMFKDCTNVKTGILDMYNQLLLNTAITNYTDCFTNCGINTLEGHYQLSQIPTSWGGLLDPNHTVTISGRTYRTVTIGNLEWMAENFELDVQGSKWYNNDSSYKDKGYGKIYTKEQALSVSLPAGWRVPTRNDFANLENTARDVTKLMAKIGWEQPGTDDYGFFALPTSELSHNQASMFIVNSEDETIGITENNFYYLFADLDASVRFVRDITSSLEA